MQFRFELPFGENRDEVLYSPATPAFQTPPEGAPISSPVIEHLLGLDDSHLAVHWHPGRFTNGPVEGYRLRLSFVEGNHTTEQVVIYLSSKEYLYSEKNRSYKHALDLC